MHSSCCRLLFFFNPKYSHLINISLLLEYLKSLTFMMLLKSLYVKNLQGFGDFLNILMIFSFSSSRVLQLLQRSIVGGGQSGLGTGLCGSFSGEGHWLRARPLVTTQSLSDVPVRTMVMLSGAMEGKPAAAEVQDVNEAWMNHHLQEEITCSCLQVVPSVSISLNNF